MEWPETRTGPGQRRHEVDCADKAGADPWIEVGRVARAVGLDGGLLVKLHGEDASNLLAAAELRLEGRPGSIPFRARDGQAAGASGDGHARARLWLVGLTTRERAEIWIGAAVSIRSSALAELAEGEFYWRDLIGLSVSTVDGRELGRVAEIWPTGSNDVLVVTRDEKTVLVPALRDVLASVDLAGGRIVIDPPDGLLEDDEESA